MAAGEFTGAAGRGVVVIPSPHSYADTIARLLRAFQTSGIKVFATIDQQAEAAAVGMTMAPATLIIFGNPKAGTPLMAARPTAGVDLPLKVFVTEPMPDEVLVVFNAAAYIIERHSLPPDLAANIAPVERLIANALSA